MSDTKAKAPAEGQISLPQLLQTMPDIFTPEGLEELNDTLTQAESEKKDLDPHIKEIAKRLGADHSSRVKDHAVALKKIAQKRLEGRNYNVSDLNDALGQRITLNNPDQQDEAIKHIENKAKQGKFKILKQQQITNESHKSYHFDIETPNGTKGELQILPSQQELADSVANHDIYQQFSEDPPPEVEKLQDLQTKIVEDLPNHKAKKLASDMLAMHKKNDDIPLPPITTAAVVAKVADK